MKMQQDCEEKCKMTGKIAWMGKGPDEKSSHSQLQRRQPNPEAHKDV